MRTHIRMHLDKKTGEVNEENFISCILDDDSTEIPPASGGVIQQTTTWNLLHLRKCSTVKLATTLRLTKQM